KPCIGSDMAMAEYNYQMMTAASTHALLDAQIEQQRADLVCLRRDLTLAQRDLISARRELVRVRLELDPARRHLANALRDWNHLQQELKSGYHGDLLVENEKLTLAIQLAEAKADNAIAKFKALA